MTMMYEYSSSGVASPLFGCFRLKNNVDLAMPYTLTARHKKRASCEKAHGTIPETRKYSREIRGKYCRQYGEISLETKKR